jgi:pyroglutamyl-peptidase
MNVIVAAFEPFGGRKQNRSQKAARRLAGTPGLEIETLPVSFARISPAVDALLKQRPRLLLLVGESAEAKMLHVDRFALNLAHAESADNDGAQPRGALLETAGPTARAVPFAVDRLVDTLVHYDIPARASAYAGTFLCNAALYHALGRTALGGTTVAFVHVPAKKSAMGAGTAARGLKRIIDALAPHDK